MSVEDFGDENNWTESKGSGSQLGDLFTVLGQLIIVGMFVFLVVRWLSFCK